ALVVSTLQQDRGGGDMRFLYGCMLAMMMAAAAHAPDVFTAQAVEGEDPSGRSVAVTFVVDRYSTDAENAAGVAALRQGTPALHALFASWPDIGSINVGDKKFPLKYIYRRARSRDRLALLTNEPIAFLGDQSRPKAGFEFAFAVLDLSLPGFGS